jgi:ribonuclease HI
MSASAGDFVAAGGGVVYVGNATPATLGARVQSGAYNSTERAEIVFAPDATGPHPSNNRGELLGFALVLSHIIQGGFSSSKVNLVCDSEYVVNTITKFIPARRADPVKAAKKPPLKNPDLLDVCESLLARLRSICGEVQIRWAKAHTTSPTDPRFRYTEMPGDPPVGSPERAELSAWIWRLNQEADSAAAAALRSDGDQSFER